MTDIRPTMYDTCTCMYQKNWFHTLNLK